ncbi:trypsin-like peptidase domain-containing protein [Pedobacter sp. P351]|uniref:trypsin-like peptidase domain-containing protein n=1 Tax=Pedobacter superstes TaxID=3133441 RepID=UPI0030A5C506
MVTALIASIITLAGSEYLHQRRDSTPRSETAGVKFANNPSKAISSEGNPDFIRSAAIVAPAVVHLKTIYERPERGRSTAPGYFNRSPGQDGVVGGSGSGVLISTDGYIITNNHVVEGASQIEVVLTDRRTLAGKVVGTDPSTDLALVKIDGRNFPIVSLGNSDKVQIGEWVLAVGYPLSLNSTVTAGIVSAKGRRIGILSTPSAGATSMPGTAIESFIQTDAAINPGNSGGALVNVSGELIGINAAIASQTGSYTGYGFAIPINLARKVVNDIREFGEVKRGYLGVSFPAPAVEDQLLRQKGINPGTIKGVYITDVKPGGAAASAGLMPGDVIQQLNGQQVHSSAEFSERIARHRPGDKITLSYLRNGKVNQATAALKGEESLSAMMEKNNKVGRELQQRFGASFIPIDPAIQKKFRLSSGIMITELKQDGFFFQAGIPEGTIITRVNGKPVNTVEEFNYLLGTSRNGIIRMDGITPDGARFMFNFPLGA